MKYEQKLFFMLLLYRKHLQSTYVTGLDKCLTYIDSFTENNNPVR